ncbi:hypothetical protein [Marisediminicola senii]|uniref:hypothetical protein n=1 Tax=Marisediminicola senii TaxID=2711233 RepID=UPI0013EDF930|nr:hypothetical protein [Marisediminicola senii]
MEALPDPALRTTAALGAAAEPAVALPAAPDPAALLLLAALRSQAAHLGAVQSRLAEVEPPVAATGGLDWRGPARMLFDLGILDLRRVMAGARIAVDDAAATTAQAVDTVAARVR